MPWGGKLLRALRGDTDAATRGADARITDPALPEAPRDPAAESPAPELSLSHEQASELLADGVRAFEAGELDQAQRALEELRASGRFSDWADFRLGMVARERGDMDAAERAFTAAIGHNRDLFWGHYERLRLPTVHADRTRRDPYAETMLDVTWEELQAPHVAQLEQVAASIWQDGKRDLAGRVLAKLWPSTALGTTALGRIVETALDPALADAAAERLAAMPGRSDAPAGAGSSTERGMFETAVHDFKGHRLAAAAVGFGRLTGSAELGAWAHFYLGRIHASGGDQAAASRSFEAALAANPKLFWAHYERIVLAREQNVPVDTLVDYVAQMSATPWEKVAENHVRELEGVAHALWDQAREREASLLLARLWPAPALSRLALIRIVEKGSDRAVQEGAISRLQQASDLDETALRVLSAYYQQHGEVDREITALERSYRLKPGDFQTWLGLIRSYAKKGDRQRAFATIEGAKAFSVKQRLFVTLIAYLEVGDLDQAFLAFRDHCRLYSEVAKFPGIRLAYLLSDLFDVPRRDEVLGILGTYFPGDKDVALVQINAAMRDQRWDTARTLFDGYFAGQTNLPQNVRQVHVDILAFSGKLEEAAGLLEAERVDGLLPVPFLRSTIRILSELDRWDQVFETGLRQIGDDTSFQHFLSPMVRASRKVGKSAQLLEGLLALPQPPKPEQLEAIHAVAEDLAEQGDTQVLERIAGVELPFERRHRIELKLRSRAGPAPVEKDLCIYYCADQNYLMPALVSLTALAMSNVSITRRAVFHLVVDADVVPFAKESGGAIAQRLGLALEVTDASTIVSSADRLRTSYGLFTGGQQLSLAAYYRIFFARWLVDQKRYTQALYIDADTIVRSGLDELFATERGVPLLARHETDRPEVRHATAVHQLKGTYFNSGVLRFDLEHPALPELLDKAIAAAIDPDVNLIFQDQCALNIAFDLNISQLPDRFNYFNPPSVSGDNISASDAVIVHFLDRPKPWDSLYRRRAREWFEWYDLVETLRQGMTLGA